MATNANIETAIAAIAELEKVHYILGEIKRRGGGSKEEVRAINRAAPLLDSYKLELSYFNMDAEAGECAVDSASTLQSFVGFALESYEDKRALAIGYEVLSREKESRCNVDKLNEALAVALAALRQLDIAAKALVLTDRRDDGHLYHDRVSTALSKIGELGRCTYSVKDDA